MCESVSQSVSPSHRKEGKEESSTSTLVPGSALLTHIPLCKFARFPTSYGSRYIEYIRIHIQSYTNTKQHTQLQRYLHTKTSAMKIVSAAIALLSLLTTASAASSLCPDGVSIGYSDVATLAADLVDPDVHAANGKPSLNVKDSSLESVFFANFP